MFATYTGSVFSPLPFSIVFVLLTSAIKEEKYFKSY